MLSLQNRRITLNSIAYTLVNILPFFSAFITLPVYTYHISPNDFGMLSLITTFSALVGISLSLQLNSALPRLYFDEDKGGVFKLFSTIFYSVALISAIGIVLISIVGNEIIGFVFPTIEHQYAPLFIIGVLTMYFIQLSTVINRLLVVEERGTIVLKRTLVVQPLGVIVGIYLVAYLQLGIVGALLATLITAIATLLINVWIVKGYFRASWNGVRFKEALKYSWPLIPHALGGWLFMYSDVIIMEKYLPLSIIALYAISDKFSQILKVVVNAIGESLSPNFIRMAKKSTKNTVIRFKRIISLWFLLVLTAWLLLSVMAEELVMLLTDEKYHSAYIYIPILAFSYVFRGMYMFSTYPIFFNKKTKIITRITIVAGLINIALNVFFIPLYGVMGAVITTMLSFMLTAIMAHYYSIRFFSMEYDWNYIIPLVIGYILAYVLLVNINTEWPIVTGVIKLLGVGAFFISAVLLSRFEIRKDILNLVTLFRN
jgi:O-antigen/teichoic acid export membrane protein